MAAKLVEAGKLDVDAPIQKYLENFPKKTFDGKPVEITSRQLMSHTSGIRHYKKVKLKIYANFLNPFFRPIHFLVIKWIRKIRVKKMTKILIKNFI